MGRAIVSFPSVNNAFPDQVDPNRPATPPQEKPDTWKERLFKYIPSEVVTLYLGLNTIVATAQDAPSWLYWVIFAPGLTGTWWYMSRFQGVTSRKQLVISTIAFAVWIFALGGPFTQIKGYKPVYGAVLLPI